MEDPAGFLGKLGAIQETVQDSMKSLRVNDVIGLGYVSERSIIRADIERYCHMISGWDAACRPSAKASKKFASGESAD